jgi:hypothetical protein
MPERLEDQRGSLNTMSIRLLHLSDLKIGGPEFGAWQKHFLEHMLDAKDACRITNVDYLIICGNITYDGARGSFGEAAEVIKSLADRLLPSDDSPSHRWNRLVLVPGQSDVRRSHQVDLQADEFGEFYRELCSHYLGESEETLCRFDLSKPVIRQLKDLTIVGLPYWNRLEEYHSDSQSGCFASLLGGIPDNIDSTEYSRRTPTLLVTSESPALAPELCRMLKDRELRRVLEQKLKLDLHLIGTAPVTCFPIEPFVFRHIGLATGPRSRNGFWPFRMNLVTFTPPGDQVCARDKAEDEGQRQGSFFAFQSLKREKVESDWDHPLAPSEGSLDSLIREDKRVLPELSPGYLPYLNSLRDRLKKARSLGGREKIVLVETLPGSFFGESLADVPPINVDGRKYELVAHRYVPEMAKEFNMNLKDTVPDNVRRDTKESMTAIADRVKKKGAEECIVVVQDDVFEEINDGGRRRDWLGHVLEELEILVVPKTALVLYAVRLVARDCLKNRFLERQLTASKPKHETSWKLLGHFLSQIPIPEDDWYRLSGIHTAFRDAVFQPMKEKFSKWQGAQTIDESSYAKLIEEAFLTEQSSSVATNRLFELSEAFYHTFEKEYNAPVRLIQQRLRKELQQVVEGERRSIGEIIVDVRQDFADQLNRDEEENLNRMMNRLHELSIVSRVRNSPAYSLNVLAPFILRLSRS